MRPNSKLFGIPCPTCKSLNQFDAKACSCGHSFVMDRAVIPSKMPPLSLVLPNQNGRTIAEKQFKTIEQPTADHPREDGVSEKELWPTLGIIDTNTESMSPDLPTFGNASKARIYRIGFGVAACIAVTCAFIAGIAVSRYSPPPDTPSMNSDASQAVTAKSNPSIESSSQRPSDKVRDPSVSDAVSKDAPVSSDGSRTLQPPIIAAESSDEQSSTARRMNPDAQKESSGVLVNRTIVVHESEDTNASPPKEKEEGAPPLNAGAVGSNKRRPIAKCNDGTFSYSAVRSDVCSQRGGVSEWTNERIPNRPNDAEIRAFILGPKGGCYYLNGSGTKVYVARKYCN